MMPTLRGRIGAPCGSLGTVGIWWVLCETVWALSLFGRACLPFAVYISGERKESLGEVGWNSGEGYDCKEGALEGGGGALETTLDDDGV